MSKFENVTIVRNANVYFDGNVTSRSIEFASGEVKTLGIMMPGDYTFGTDRKEIMEIQAGEVDIRLPGSAQWESVAAGGVFEVPANASFDIKVKVLTDYCCSYID